MTTAPWLRVFRVWVVLATYCVGIARYVAGSPWKTYGDEQQSYISPTSQDIFLKGKYIELGINKYGSLGTIEGTPTGGRLINPLNALHGQYDVVSLLLDTGKDGFDQPAGGYRYTGDVFMPGQYQFESWALTFMRGGVSRALSGSRDGGPNPNSVEDLSTNGLLRAKVVNEGGGVRISHQYQFLPEGLYAIVSVLVENVGAGSITDIVYTRGGDPDGEHYWTQSMVTDTWVSYGPSIGAGTSPRIHPTYPTAGVMYTGNYNLGLYHGMATLASPNFDPAAWSSWTKAQYLSKASWYPYTQGNPYRADSSISFFITLPNIPAGEQNGFYWAIFLSTAEEAMTLEALASFSGLLQPSSTPSPSPSLSPTPSRTPSPSPTPTPTRTRTPTPSRSSSPTPSTSSSATPTSSVTPSTSSSRTPSMSPSTTPTPSPSPSSTPTPSTSSSPSPSPSPYVEFVDDNFLMLETETLVLQVEDISWNITNIVCAASTPHLDSIFVQEGSGESPGVLVAAPHIPGLLLEDNLTCTVLTTGGNLSMAATIQVLQQPYPAFDGALYSRGDGEWLSATTAFGFDITTNGNGTVELHSASKFLFGNYLLEFPGSTVTVQVHIGPVLLDASDLDIIDGGASLLVQLPTYEEMCYSADGLDACATTNTYYPLCVSYAAALPTEHIAWTTSVTCPPHCPGGFGRGIFYTLECEGYPTGPTCYNPDTAGECAFGLGDNCQSCPKGAICPGGYRAWPLPGYWSPSERNPKVLPCAPPSQQRCLGYRHGSFNGSVCGRGYSQSSYMCLACDTGYYEVDGSCLECPDAEAQLAIALIPFLILGSYMTALFFGSCALLRYAIRRAGLPAKWSILIPVSADFVFWQFIIFQSLAQLARNTVPGLPQSVRNTFNFLQLFQMEVGGLLPPECTDTYAFFRPLLFSGGGIALALGFYVLLFTSFRRCSSVCKTMAAWLLYLTSAALCLTYPLLTNNAVETITCIQNEETGKLILFNSPFYSCYEGLHFLPAVASWALILLVTLGMPLSFCVGGRRVTRKFLQQRSSPSKWYSVTVVEHRQLRENRSWYALFTYGQPWFRPAYLMYLCFLSFADRFLEAQGLLLARGIIDCAVNVGFGVFVFFAKPDHEWDTWKRYPRFFVFLAATLTGIMQIALAIEGIAQNRLPNLDETQEPLRLSHISVALCWVSLGCCFLLPPFLFVSYLRWLFYLAGLKLTCCKSTKKQPPQRRRRKALIAKFLAEFGDADGVEDIKKTSFPDDPLATVHYNPLRVVTESKQYPQNIYRKPPYSAVVVAPEPQNEEEDDSYEFAKEYTNPAWGMMKRLIPSAPSPTVSLPPQQAEQLVTADDRQSKEVPEAEEAPREQLSEGTDTPNYEESSAPSRYKPLRFGAKRSEIELADLSEEARRRLLGKKRRNSRVRKYVQAVTKLHGKHIVVRRKSRRHSRRNSRPSLHETQSVV